MSHLAAAAAAAAACRSPHTPSVAEPSGNFCGSPSILPVSVCVYACAGGREESKTYLLPCTTLTSSPSTTLTGCVLRNAPGGEDELKTRRAGENQRQANERSHNIWAERTLIGREHRFHLLNLVLAVNLSVRRCNETLGVSCYQPVGTLARFCCRHILML